METLIKGLYAIISLIIMILWVVLGFKKEIIHFKLIKRLYSPMFDDTSSYYRLMWGFRMFRLDFFTMLWFISPIYYTKINPENFDKENLFYHFRLKKITRNFLLLIVIYFAWLYGVGFL